MDRRFLDRVSLFAGLDDAALERLAARFSRVDLPAHAVVFRHGDAADAFYLISFGEVTVARDEVGKPVRLLARLGPGDFFGEQGLFGEARRSASARTTAPTALLRIGREELLAFLEDRPVLALRLQTAAAQRHSQNAAGSLDLARASEVRIRVGRPVELVLADGARTSAVLENLSTGGLSLSAVPPGWTEGAPVRFTLRHADTELAVVGRVTWRRGHGIGVAFTDPDDEHEARISRVLRQLRQS